MVSLIIQHNTLSVSVMELSLISASRTMCHDGVDVECLVPPYFSVVTCLLYNGLSRGSSKYLGVSSAKNKFQLP